LPSWSAFATVAKIDREEPEMPSLDVLLAFAVTTAIFAFIPGPAMLYAAARTMAGGRAAGLMAVLGIHLGSYAHIIAAAAGLSALFHAVPVAYTVVKLLGAAYLVWLGISLFRSTDMREEGDVTVVPKGGRRAFIQSITVEVLNPKTAIFFLAFLPQFVDSGASLPVWVQLAILGTMVNLIFTFADIVTVLLADVILARLKRSSGVQALVRRAGGTILIGLGAHLALQKG
jgi:threonine/homoserine/homoserine lactone efflux protein